MKKLKFELFVTINNKQQVFVLDENPISIGSAPNCNILIADGDPPVKVVFQLDDNAMAVKAYDLNYPIKINGKKYKSAKLKNSIFFKVGAIDVILAVEEVTSVATPADNEILEDFEDVEYNTSINVNMKLDTTSLALPDKQDIIREKTIVRAQEELPSDKPDVFEPTSTEISTPVVEELQKSVEQTEQKASFSTSEVEDVIKFSIKFNEDNFRPLGFEAYSHPHLDFSSYIDPEDETIEQEPSRPLVEENEGYSLHVIHMNNGTVLEEKFFSAKFKRVYLSDSFGKKNYFKAHDCELDKSELAFIKGNYVSAVKQPGFRMAKLANKKVYDIKEQTLQILPGEKIILTKGTSQIIMQLSKATPTVRPQNYFDFDEDLLKSIAYAWVFAAFVLINVLIVDSKEEKKFKQVVIYKKVEVQKKKEIEKTVAEVQEPKVEQEAPKKADKPKEVPQEKVVKKKVEKKPEKVVQEKKVVKKVDVKKPEKKPAVKKQLKVAEKVKKADPKPKPKKTYKFNFASKMASSLSTSPTKLKAAQSSSSVNVASAMNSSSKVTSNYDPKSIGVGKTKVDRFAAGSVSGKTKMMGTKGLSGKTSSTTAYIEAKTKVLGALDPNLIRKIMREYIPQFRRCYQRELLTNPSVSGVFDLSFKINKYGRGTGTRVKSNGKGFSKEGMTCVKRVVKLIKFPRPKGGGYVDVKQPMNFFTNQ